jgi:hypothetical protein
MGPTQTGGTATTGAPVPPAAVEQPGKSNTAATPAAAATALTVFLVLFPFMIFPFFAGCWRFLVVLAFRHMSSNR